MANAALERAIEVLGGPTEASHVLRVSYWTIREWRKAERVRDSRMAILLAEAAQEAGATEITVRALAGLEVVGGNGGGGPEGGVFLNPPHKSSATDHVLASLLHQVPSPDLPVVPRYPDTAANAA